MSYSGLLTQVADVYRPTMSVSDSGETIKTYPVSPSATGVACLIQAMRGGLFRWEVGETLEAVYKGFFNLTADLQEGDRIIVSSITYDIMFVDRVSSHHIECILSRGFRKA